MQAKIWKILVRNFPLFFLFDRGKIKKKQIPSGIKVFIQTGHYHIKEDISFRIVNSSVIRKQVTLQAWNPEMFKTNGFMLKVDQVENPVWIIVFLEQKEASMHEPQWME